MAPKFAEELKAQSEKHGAVMYYWYSPDPLNSLLKGRRIQFPLYQPGCAAKDTFNPDGPVLCDFKGKELAKMVSTRLRKSFPAALYVLRKLTVGSEEVDEMLGAHSVRGTSGGKVAFDVACAG